MIFVDFPAWFIIPVIVISVIVVLAQPSKEKRSARKAAERKAEQKRLIHEFVDSRPIEDFEASKCFDTAGFIAPKLGLPQNEVAELIRFDLLCRGIDYFEIGRTPKGPKPK